jgi:hypothetical protein
LGRQLAITAVLPNFLRVNAQMHNLDKQKTRQGRKPLAASGGPTAGQKSPNLMTTRLIIILTLSLTFLRSQNNISNDSLFKLTWNKFAKAVLNKDLKTFKMMSTSCVNCSWCLTNTAKEDTLLEAYKVVNEKTWYDKIYSELSYFSIDKFINEDYDFIFTEEVNARLLNATKLNFIDDNHNAKVYYKPCIIGKVDKTKLDFKEVLLTIVDPSPKYEGAQLAFAFVKIKGQYKFCGFSTIP